MKIFVAGANGQVALSLKESALRQGISLLTAGRPDFDLSNEESMHATIEAFAPTILVNAAAYTAVDAAEDDETAAHKINSAGAGALARIADKLDIPFIHISTDYVFDGLKERAYTEDDTVRPTGAYGRSKLAGEIVVHAETSKAITLRTAWVYSPFGKNFLKTMLMLAKSRDTLGVVADQVGNPTYAPDIADAILAICSTIENDGWQNTYAGIYHLTGTGGTSWHGFASEIFELAAGLGHPRPMVNAITTVDFPTPAKRPANSKLDCSKLKRVFGIELPDWHKSTEACIKRLFDAGF